jgi:SAM-dependent methyltransferase
MAEKHFHEQIRFTTDYLFAYFEKYVPDFGSLSVLEVGCGEGGAVAALQDRGMLAMGVELEASRIEIGLKINPKLPLLAGDITDPHLPKRIGRRFKLIIMRDVIEHVSNRSALFQNINTLLEPEGYFYVTFPPRFSPYAGHQQNARTVLRYIPYLHLFPDFLIDLAGKHLHENPKLIDSVKENYRIGLSVSAFDDYVKEFGFTTAVRDLFLVRPVFKLRFGLTPRKFPDLPILRELMATGCEVLLKAPR